MPSLKRSEWPEELASRSAVAGVFVGLALLAAILVAGCSTPATPARTAYIAAASADAASTIYGVSRGYKELNPIGPIAAIALKGAFFLLADRLSEPWRSRVFWIGTTVNLGGFVNNAVVLTKSTKEDHYEPALRIHREPR